MLFLLPVRPYLLPLQTPMDSSRLSFGSVRAVKPSLPPQARRVITCFALFSSLGFLPYDTVFVCLLDSELLDGRDCAFFIFLFLETNYSAHLK